MGGVLFSCRAKILLPEAGKESLILIVHALGLMICKHLRPVRATTFKHAPMPMRLLLVPMTRILTQLRFKVESSGAIAGPH